MVNYLIFLVIFIPSLEIFRSKLNITKRNPKKANLALINYLLFATSPYDLNQVKKLPEFKFYKEILLQILEFNKKFGSPIQRSLEILLTNLKKEEELERKISDLLQTSYFQFFILLLVIICFMCLVISITEFEYSYKILIGLILWPIIGILLFRISSIQIYKYLFRNYENWLSHLAFFRTFIEIGKPLSYCLEKYPLQKLSKEGIFQACYHDFQQGVTELNLKGKPILTLIKTLEDRLWGFYNFNLERYLKILNILRLIILFIFFLGSYFAFLGLFISTILSF